MERNRVVPKSDHVLYTKCAQVRKGTECYGETASDFISSCRSLWASLLITCQSCKFLDRVGQVQHALVRYPHSHTSPAVKNSLVAPL